MVLIIRRKLHVYQRLKVQQRFGGAQVFEFFYRNVSIFSHPCTISPAPSPSESSPKGNEPELFEKKCSGVFQKYRMVCFACA